MGEWKEENEQLALDLKLIRSYSSTEIESELSDSNHQHWKQHEEEHQTHQEHNNNNKYQHHSGSSPNIRSMMFAKLPTMMNNSKQNEYTDIDQLAAAAAASGGTGGAGAGAGAHPNTSDRNNANTRRQNVGERNERRSARRNNNQNNRFWDFGSFFQMQNWTITKYFMVGMVLLLLIIIVIQGVEERQEIEKKTQVHTLKVLANEQKEIAKENSDDDAVDAVDKEEPKLFSMKDSQHKIKDIPMPPGINIGSWLSLEDYFWSGQDNQLNEVASPGQLNNASRVASCLPPLLIGKKKKWFSETDLFMDLMNPKITPVKTNKNGVGSNRNVPYAIEVFQAHRTSFIDLEYDLERIASLGIQTIRIPMSWCLTEHDPRHTLLHNLTDDELLEKFACEDPFFNKNTATPDVNGETSNPIIYWPAVPKPFVEDILRACSRVGLKVSLDSHTYPGGTSIGTFSGVWPNWPRFWTHGGDGIPIARPSPIEAVYTNDSSSTSKSVSNDKKDNTMKSKSDTTKSSNNNKKKNADGGFNIGHVLFQELVTWMEELSVRDAVAFQGLRGLSPMNEPAHLAGTFHPEDSNNFLPPLPQELGSNYRKQLSTLKSSVAGASSSSSNHDDNHDEHQHEQEHEHERALVSLSGTQKQKQKQNGLKQSSRKKSIYDYDYPNGTHLRVFYWLQQTIDIFRRSKLPALGKELHVNVHESVFRPLTTNDKTFDCDNNKCNERLQLKAIAAWWCANSKTDNSDDTTTDSNNETSALLSSSSSSSGTTTTKEERASWAILDVHHYMAWSDTTCTGTIDGQDNAAYACQDTKQRHKVLKNCTRWAQTFRDIVTAQCNSNSHTVVASKSNTSSKTSTSASSNDNSKASTSIAGSSSKEARSSTTTTTNTKNTTTTTTTKTEDVVVKLMSAEFSAASYHNSQHSCNDVGGLHESYMRQVKAASSTNADVELFYWSYKMPYGGTFRQAGWSFTQLLYDFGVVDRPDQPQFECS